MPAPTLKILTANELRTGDVFYWKAGNWVGAMADADVFADELAATAALVLAQTAVTANQIVSPYLFDVRQDKDGLHPIKEREIIRSRGPSVRSDTGKQAVAPHV